MEQNERVTFQFMLHLGNNKKRKEGMRAKRREIEEERSR